MAATEVVLARRRRRSGTSSAAWWAMLLLCAGLLVGCSSAPAAAPGASQSQSVGPTSTSTSKAETVRLSLKAQANPWSSVPASIIEDAAVAGCASLRDQGDVVARIEDIHSTADIVSKNPDPTGQKPALTYDQAVALQMTMASVYCPELGVRS